MTDRLQQITIPVQHDPLEAPMPQTLAWLAMPRRWDLLSWVAVVVLGGGRAAAPAASPTRLRVASCTDQRKPQPIWDAVPPGAGCGRRPVARGTSG